MQYREITCSSLITPITRPDTLFQGSFTIDPYQYCEFNCQYCDSAHQDTVYIKSNAVERFRQEIQSLKPGRLILGSVHDPYQPAEHTYNLTRKLIQEIHQAQFPCHILTKSTMILKDLDILKKISDCTVTLSFCTTSTTQAQIFEPTLPSPTERFNTLTTLEHNNIHTGVALIPILPLITENHLEDIITKAADHHSHYFLHAYLELKGDQKQHFLSVLQNQYPDLVRTYERLYNETTTPQSCYTKNIDTLIQTQCQKNHLPQTVRKK